MILTLAAMAAAMLPLDDVSVEIKALGDGRYLMSAHLRSALLPEPRPELLFVRLEDYGRVTCNGTYRVEQEIPVETTIRLKAEDADVNASIREQLARDIKPLSPMLLIRCGI